MSGLVSTEKLHFRVMGKWLLLVVVIILLADIISANWYQLTLIQGDSMSPSYCDKQLVLLDKHSKYYAVNDVVAFRCEALKTNLVKRIAAGPGDEVVILAGTLYVNDELSTVYRKYGIFSYAGLAEQRIKLRDGQYFVLGDNIAESKDSRYTAVGIVSEKDIIGKVIP